VVIISGPACARLSINAKPKQIQKIPIKNNANTVRGNIFMAVAPYTPNARERPG
jgi:hypothetical protein